MTSVFSCGLDQKAEQYLIYAIYLLINLSMCLSNLFMLHGIFDILINTRN